ncbi:MAG: transcriptional regulator [Nitrososphaerota archaeon]
MPDEHDLLELKRFRVFLSNPYRIAIMFTLEASGYMRFSELNSILGSSSGNTAYHLRVLEGMGLISSVRVSEGGGGMAVYEMTERGKTMFREFMELMRRLLDL